ncbi:hypothetical protein E4099_31675, partial [Streptomyces palmae]
PPPLPPPKDRMCPGRWPPSGSHAAPRSAAPCRRCRPRPCRAPNSPPRRLPGPSARVLISVSRYAYSVPPPSPRRCQRRRIGSRAWHGLR